MRKLVTAFIAVVAILTLGGCAKATEPFKDAPRGSNNEEPADVVQMPDGFNNMATKCDHGFRIYSTFHGDSSYGSIAAVPDPNCPQQ